MTAPTNGQTVTSISPPVVGQAIGRATARLTFNGTYNSGRTVTDGLAISVTNTYGRPNRTYEFDVAGNGVNITGAIPVIPTSAVVDVAVTELVEVINNDADTPFWAVYTYGDYGIANGWLVLVWKYDNEFRAGAGGTMTVTEAYDPSPAPNDITINSDFSTNYAVVYATYFQLRGTGLTALTASSVKLRHDVNTSEVYGTIATTGFPVKFDQAATVKIALSTGVGTPPVFPSLGDYDLEINGVVVIDKAVKLVENLLDDPSVRHTASTADSYVNHNFRDQLIGPYWLKTQSSTNTAEADGTRSGSVWRQLQPRIYPFQTHAAPDPNPNYGDCESGSLQWSTAGGVHRLWQSVYRNFTAGTPLTLTGLWAAGADQLAMTYGVQLRSGGPDGTIFAETPPGQKLVDGFDWADFAIGGVVPADTPQVTVVFYGNHPGTGKKALHFDELLLRVDTDHPTPPSLTEMTTPNYAAAGTSSVTVTLNGSNLTPGQTSVKLQGNIISFGCANWGDVGRFVTIPWESYEKARAFTTYQWQSGDILVVTGGTGVTLGQYSIARKVHDGQIELATDINPDAPAGTDITDKTVAGYILQSPITASGVTATGSQVTATFDLTGAAPGQRNIVVEVGNNLPVMWRDGFTIAYPGPGLTNGSFELPDSTQSCENRVETFSAATDWHVRHWNRYMDDVPEGDNVPEFRDDRWVADGYDLPSCPAPELGLHYHSTVVYNSIGTAQWSQTVSAEVGSVYTLSGFFGHSARNKVSLSLLDGNSAAAPMAGASVEVLPAGSFQDWTFAHVSGTASGGIITAAWEVENQGANGPRVAWTDHLVLSECTQPVSVASVDTYAVANDTVGPITLTITGSGFTGTPEVYLTRIGQTIVATDVAVLSDTELTCQVTGLASPATQAFEVVVRNNGCIDSRANGFVSAQTAILNEQFEEPSAALECDPRKPKTDPVSYWHFADELIREGDVHAPAECPLLSCSCPEPMEGCAGGHYASMSTGEGEEERAWQTLKVTPGSGVIFGGWFSWGGPGTVNLKLVDGYGPNGTVLATAPVPQSNEWCYSAVEGFATGHLVTVVWELVGTVNGTPSAVHADHMTFGATICHNPFADVDNDGDVDQEDFAVFQICYTGPQSGSIPMEPAYCSCLDVHPLGAPDGSIDTGDLTLFEACASGPGIEAAKDCANP